MKKFTRTLLGTITDRAKASFGEELPVKVFTKEIEDKWIKHWFDTANIVRDEFAAEGLKETTAAIDTIIEHQRKFHLNIPLKKVEENA